MCQGGIGEGNNGGLNLAVLPGDGVGCVVTTQALNVLQAVGKKFGYSLNVNEGLVGGVAIDDLGKSLSYEILCVIVKYAKAGLERRIVPNVRRPNLRGE